MADLAYGIDLGTHHTLAAAYQPSQGKLETLPLHDGRLYTNNSDLETLLHMPIYLGAYLLPSAVSIIENEPLVGDTTGEIVYKGMYTRK